MNPQNVESYLICLIIAMGEQCGLGIKSITTGYLQ